MALKSKFCSKCKKRKKACDFKKTAKSPDGLYIFCEACNTKLENQRISKNSAAKRRSYAKDIIHGLKLDGRDY